MKKNRTGVGTPSVGTSIARTLVATSAAVMLGNLACSDTLINPNYCAFTVGDAFCAARHPGGDRPYCIRGSEACRAEFAQDHADEGTGFDGCVATPPPEGDACYAPCGSGGVAEDGVDCLPPTASTDTISTVGDAGETQEPTGEMTTVSTMGATGDSTGGSTGGTTGGSTDDTMGGVECLDDRDCVSVPSGPFCVSSECVPCDQMPDGDGACSQLSPDAPFCDTVTDACVPCDGLEDGNAACVALGAGTPFCDSVSHACVSSCDMLPIDERDAACTALDSDAPFCSAGNCVPCDGLSGGMQDSACEMLDSSAPFCDSASHACVSCDLLPEPDRDAACESQDAAAPFCDTAMDACVSCEVLADGNAACEMRDSGTPFCDPGGGGCTSSCDVFMPGEQDDACMAHSPGAPFCHLGDCVSCDGLPVGQQDMACVMMNPDAPFCDVMDGNCTSCDQIPDGDDACLAQFPLDPFCDTVSDSCVSCDELSDGDAACLARDASLPFCDANVGTCAASCDVILDAANADAACATLDPSTPFCDAGSCVSCDQLMDGDAACAAADASNPLCINGVCAGCDMAEQAACEALDLACDPLTGSCVSCTAHEQCTVGACDVFDGHCFPNGLDVVQVGTSDYDIEGAIEGIADGDHLILQLDPAGGPYDNGGDGTITINGSKTVAILGAYGLNRPSIALGSGANHVIEVREAATVYLQGVEFSGYGDIVPIDCAQNGRLDMRGLVVSGNELGIDLNSCEARAENSFFQSTVLDESAVVVRGNSTAEFVFSTLTTDAGGMGGNNDVLTCENNSVVAIRNSLLVSDGGGGDPEIGVGCPGVFVDNSVLETDSGVMCNNCNILEPPLSAPDNYPNWFLDFSIGNLHLDTMQINTDLGMLMPPESSAYLEIAVPMPNDSMIDIDGELRDSAMVGADDPP